MFMVSDLMFDICASFTVSSQQLERGSKFAGLFSDLNIGPDPDVESIEWCDVAQLGCSLFCWN